MKLLTLPLLIIATILIPAQAKYSGGSGTADDPYQISDANDLLVLAGDTNDYDANFILTADINLISYTFSTAVIARDVNNEYCNDFDGTAFTGSFDGAGHKVINLKIDTYGEENDFLGLFGYIWRGTVKNLTVENVSIISGNDESCCLGGLVGSSKGFLSNCHSTGIVIGGEDSALIGGLAGYGISITNCSSRADVTGGHYANFLGGLVGYNDGIIRSSYSTGTVTGDHSLEIGGLAGTNSWASIIDCYSTGEVNGGDFSNYVGGLVGSGWWYDHIISNCYSTGVVTGADHIGGLVGWGDPTVSSYFLNTSGPNNGIGIPLSEAEMKQNSSFVGWDFIETWGIEENQTRPFLKQTFSPGDLNRDRSVDFFDLAILAQHWLEGL